MGGKNIGGNLSAPSRGSEGVGYVWVETRRFFFFIHIFILVRVGKGQVYETVHKQEEGLILLIFLCVYRVILFLASLITVLSVHIYYALEVYIMIEEEK